MTPAARAYIRGQLDGIVDFLRMTHPSLTRGEIYDAIAQDLERRCRAVIDMQSQQQQESVKHSGLASLGQQGKQESEQ